MTTTPALASYGEAVTWQPERPRFKPTRLLLSWALTGASLWIAAAILPGVDIAGTAGALAVAAVVAVLNAVLPPLLAALRLPFMIALGFVLVLVLNAVVLKLASDLLENTFTVDNFGWALLAALVVAAASVVLDVIFGTNDDDTYTLRVVQRIAKRQGGAERTDVPGVVFLEIDGLALPVLRRAMRDGNTPNMARWVAEGTHDLTEWEPDLSSQTGASQAGILLGSNDDIPAFRWVDKESGLLTACSAPDDCAKIERDRATGIGLLIDGGTSRGNLLSGEADEVILTVSRIEAEKRANPGYRAFFANGFNVTRALVLFFWELCLEWTSALRAIRRDVRPRGHRGGVYPFMRAAMCVIVRDLIVYGVLTDMMRGRPAVYATFSSYDEVAHHSGLERSDTLEALRKLDQQFCAHRPGPALRAPAVRARRPVRPRSDPGSDVQAAERLRPRRAGRALAGTGLGHRGLGRRRATLDGRACSRRGDGTARQDEAPEEGCVRPLRRRARLGEPGVDLAARGAAPADPGGDRRAASRSSYRPSARIPTSAGCSCARHSGARWHSERTAPTTSPKARSRARTRSHRSRPRPHSTCFARTASRT